jgi:hypothetical protein
MPAPNSPAFATAQLDRLMGFFPRVEAKASCILALNVAMLGVLAVNFPVRAIDSPRGCCGIIATLALILSLSQLYVVFSPTSSLAKSHRSSSSATSPTWDGAAITRPSRP